MSQSRLTPTADLPSIVEGDDVPIPVSFSDPDGEPIDISGWTVSLTIAEPNGDPIIEKDVSTHDDAANGETSFALEPSDTSDIMNSKRYDIQVTKSDGTVKTVVIGHVAFVDGYTDREVS